MYENNAGMRHCDNQPAVQFVQGVCKMVDGRMKEFIVIGNQNAITYKDIFPHLQKQQMWIGYNKVTGFISYYGGNGKVGCRWFTTLPITDKEPLVLTARYSPEKYPKYDNYDAIEVGAVKDIPFDYSGVMGVPVSFFDKYCHEQFEIVGLFTEANGECFIQGSEVNTDEKHQHSRCPVLNKKRLYPRILMRNAQFEIVGYGCGNRGKEIGVAKNHRGRTDLEIFQNGKYIEPYKRILIRKCNGRKQVEACSPNS